MSRRNSAEKKEVLPDPKYGNVILSKLMNCVMVDGKKSVSSNIVYGACDLIEKITGKDPLPTFEECMKNIMPSLEVRSRRVGGATYQVPVEVNARRRQILALRWLVTFAKKRSEKTMKERLAKEMIDAANNRGGAVKKREDTHKMAEANKAFSHFRW